MKILQCIQNDVVVKFNDVMNCALCSKYRINILSNQKINYNAVLLCGYKIHDLKDSASKMIKIL